MTYILVGHIVCVCVCVCVCVYVFVYLCVAYLLFSVRSSSTSYSVLVHDQDEGMAAYVG